MRYIDAEPPGGAPYVGGYSYLPATTVIAGGGLIVLATATPLVWSNSPWGDGYRAFWETRIEIGFTGFHRSFPARSVVNEGMITVVMFLITLMVKQELIVGQLASRCQAALPIMATLGAFGSLLFFDYLLGPADFRQVAALLATDVGLIVALIAMLRDRIPIALAAFMGASAAMSSVGALGIAVVTDIWRASPVGIGAVLGLWVLMTVFRRLLFRSPVLWITVAFTFWALIAVSGAHSAIAGPLFAAALPVLRRSDTSKLHQEGRTLLHEFERLADSPEPGTYGRQQDVIAAVRMLAVEALPPGARGIRELHQWVWLFILPISVFANAGLQLQAAPAQLSALSVISLLLGILVVKPVGAMLGTVAGITAGLTFKPRSVSWRQLIIACGSTCVGLSSCLLVSAITGSLTAELGVAVIASSLLGGAVSYALLFTTTRNF